MKKVYNILSIMLSVLLILLPTASYASSNEKSTTALPAEWERQLSFEEISQLEGASVTNEFDAYLEKRLQSEEILFAEGFTSDEVRMIKDETCRGYIAKLKAYNDQELAMRGLTKDEISNLRSAAVLGDNGLTEEILRAYSANLAISIVPNTCIPNKLNYTIWWHWDKPPMFRFLDGISTAWSNGLLDGGGSTAVVVYQQYANPQITDESRLTYSNIDSVPGQGMTFEFQMEKVKGLRFWAQGGRAFVSLAGNVGNGVGVSTKYGHSEIGLTSLGVTFTGLSINFGKHVSVPGKAYVLIKP